MFSLICTWLNGWVNNGEIGDFRRHRAHYDVTVMTWWFLAYSAPIHDPNQWPFIVNRGIHSVKLYQCPNVSVNEIYLKMVVVICWPFCLSLNMLTGSVCMYGYLIFHVNRNSVQRPLLLTRINFSVWINDYKMWDEIKFSSGKGILCHILLGMWLLFHVRQ